MIVISYELFQVLMTTLLLTALTITGYVLLMLARRILRERRHQEGLADAAEQKWNRRKRGNSW